MDRIIFEVITPPVTWDDVKVAEWSKHVCEIMQRQGIYVLNLSEIVNESRIGERAVPYAPKIDNIAFAEIIKKDLPEVVPVPTKISVRLPPSEFMEWVDNIYNKGIRHLVIVGPGCDEPSNIGPSVT